MTTYQFLALLGIFLIVLSSLAMAWEVGKSRGQLRKTNALLKDLLTTMRDRL